jgi:hypothetical protein
MTDIWNLADSWSPHCKIVINAAIINIFNAIWLARNNARFNNLVANWRSSVSSIYVDVATVGNFTSNLSSSSIRDFTILQCFTLLF